MRSAAGWMVFALAACSHEPRRVAVPVKDAPSCADLEPDHAKAVADTQRSFEEALAAKGLTPTTLDPVPTLDTREDRLDPTHGQRIAAWTLFFVRDLRAVASEPFVTNRGPEPVFDFAKDGNGVVWHVRRAPKQRTVREASVQACKWGCWGPEPSGVYVAYEQARRVWVIPFDVRYGGEVTVEYDAPTVVEHVLDMNCPMPP